MSLQFAAIFIFLYTLFDVDGPRSKRNNLSQNCYQLVIKLLLILEMYKDVTNKSRQKKYLDI